MTEKQEIINKIKEFPTSYALLLGFLGENKDWDKQRLEFTELVRLKDIFRDLKTFERNKKQINE